MRKRLLGRPGRVCLCATLFVLLTLSVISVAAPRKTVKIGVLLPFSGSRAALGQEARRGMEIALDILREKGGIKGEYDIQPIWCDITSVDSGIAEARRLIEIEKVPVIVGTALTDVAVAASAIAEQAHVVYIESCNPADALTQRGFRYLFRINPVGYLEGQSLAKFLCENAGAMGRKPSELRIAVVGVDNQYGTAIVDGAVDKIKELGAKLVHKEQYSASVTDLSSMIMKLKMLKADAVISASAVEDGMLLYRQARELGLEVKAMIGTGTSFGSQMFQDRFGYLAEGALAGNYTIENSPERFAPGLRDFFQRYKAKYKQEPIISSLCLGTYQAILILGQIMENAKSLTSDDIRKSAVEIDIPSGTLGNGWGAKFAPPGHPSQGTNVAADMVIVTQWKNGQLYQVWPEPSDGINLVLPQPTWSEREALRNKK